MKPTAEKQMEVRATPRPWLIAPNNPRKIVSDSIDGFDPLTAENYVGGVAAHPYASANIELIIRAVNSHDDLVAACKLAIAANDKNALHNHCPMTTEMIAAHEALKAALQKAETR